MDGVVLDGRADQDALTRSWIGMTLATVGVAAGGACRWTSSKNILPICKRSACSMRLRSIIAISVFPLSSDCGFNARSVTQTSEKSAAAVTCMCDHHGRTARLCRGSILFIFNGWVGQSRLFARVHEFNVDAQYTYRNSLAFELTLPNVASHSTARELIDAEVSRIEDFDSASKTSDPVKLPSTEMTSSVIPSLL